MVEKTGAYIACMVQVKQEPQGKSKTGLRLSTKHMSSSKFTDKHNLSSFKYVTLKALLMFSGGKFHKNVIKGC